MTKPDLSVSLGGKTLKNPVGTASGTFGFGEEYKDLINLNRLGAIFTKAVTRHPRPGNPAPRLAETPGGLINSIGLANPGAELFLKEKLPFLQSLESAVIVNVAGSTQEEYEETLELLEEGDPRHALWGWEINISCPNVKKGGLAFGTDPRMVEDLTRRLRKMTKRPLIMKLTPNVTDIAEIAKAAEAGGADGVSCINTLRGMMIDINKMKTAIPAPIGGLSGPAVLPVGLAAVYQVSRAVNLPVIGLGGISSGEDVIRYLLAGAASVQIGTGTMVDPALPEAALEELIRYMKQKGFSRLGELREALRTGD